MCTNFVQNVVGKTMNTYKIYFRLKSKTDSAYIEADDIDLAYKQFIHRFPEANVHIVHLVKKPKKKGK